MTFISWCYNFIFQPCAGFLSQGNEFSYYMMICSNFILNQYVDLSNISCLSSYLFFIMLMISLFLSAPKRLMNGPYILGYTATAILFQTMINFGLFHFLIFIPQGAYIVLSPVFLSVQYLFNMMCFLLFLQKCDLWISKYLNLVVNVLLHFECIT